MSDEKRLIPEVLPTPTKGDARSPRERVTTHVRKLLTAGAVAMTCAGTTPEHQPGYGVVDMIPAPPECRVAREYKVTGTAWSSPSENAIHVSLTAWRAAEGLAFTDPVRVTGGTTSRMKNNSGWGEMTVTPAQGAQKVTFETSLTCDGEPVTAMRRIQVSILLGGASPTVRKHDFPVEIQVLPPAKHG